MISKLQRNELIKKQHLKFTAESETASKIRRRLANSLTNLNPKPSKTQGAPTIIKIYNRILTRKTPLIPKPRQNSKAPAITLKEKLKRREIIGEKTNYGFLVHKPRKWYGFLYLPDLCTSNSKSRIKPSVDSFGNLKPAT